MTNENNLEKKTENSKEYTLKDLIANIIKTPLIYYAIAKYSSGIFLGMNNEDSPSLHLAGMYLVFSGIADFCIFSGSLMGHNARKDINELFGLNWPSEIGFPYSIYKAFILIKEEKEKKK